MMYFLVLGVIWSPYYNKNMYVSKLKTFFWIITIISSQLIKTL